MNAPVAEAVKGHNKGPLIVPTEDDINTSLNDSYPTVATEYAEIMEAAKSYPVDITEDDQASALQALIKKGKNAKSSWKAWRGEEKKVWTGVANLVFSFFNTKEEKLGEVLDDLNDRLTKFSEAKAEKAKVLAAERAEAERKAALELAEKAAYAAETQLMAEAFTELAEWNEADAKRRQREHEEAQMMAEARAELAAYDERKALERKAIREAEEAAQRKADVKNLKAYNREADKLAVKDKAETITEEEKGRYKELIGTGGLIPNLTAKLAGDRSHLSADEVAELDAEESNLKRLRDERVENHAAAEKAKLAKQKAATEAKGHMKAGVESASDAKAAGRDAVSLGRQAEKQDVRAEKSEAKAGGLSDADASRHRGDHGTTSSLSGRWMHSITDFGALPADQLWRLIPDDVKSAAVTKWMREHQTEWGEKEVVKDALPGVTFFWDTSAVVR